MTSGWLSRACARPVKLLSRSRAPRFYTRELSWRRIYRVLSSYRARRNIPRTIALPTVACDPTVSNFDGRFVALTLQLEKQKVRRYESADNKSSPSGRTEMNSNIFVVAIRLARRAIVDNHHEHMSAASALCFRPHSDVE